MKKVILALLFFFLIFGMMLDFAIIQAKDDSSVSNSGSSDLSASDNNTEDSDSSDNSVVSASDDNNESIRERIRDSEESKHEFNKSITSSGGNKIRIQREVEIEDGQIKIKIKKEFVLANGTKIEIQIEIQRDKNGTAKEISINGQNFNISREIEINDLFEGNESELEAVLSNGNSTGIKILPQQASNIARERLGEGNISNFTLEEVSHKNIPRVVYNIEANQNGRFLGIFKLAMKSETKIDAGTGDILEVNQPWWAFMVSVPKENSSSGQ